MKAIYKYTRLYLYKKRKRIKLVVEYACFSSCMYLRHIRNYYNDNINEFNAVNFIRKNHIED